MADDDRGRFSLHSPHDDAAPNAEQRATAPPTHETRPYDTPGGPPRYTAPPRNGLGTTALVLGIIALILAVLFFPLGLLLALLAIGFGIAGRTRARHGKATNRGAATTGLVFGVLALLLSAALALAGAVFFQQFRDCFGSGMSQSEIRQCVQDEIRS